MGLKWFENCLQGFVTNENQNHLIKLSLMNGKRIIGFILLFGAVFAFGNKLVAGMSGNSNNGVLLYILGIFGLLLLLGIRRVLRN